MKKEKYLYGFKNIHTGDFMPTYRTIRRKEKVCCFRTELNANKALQYQHDKENYIVTVMAKAEENI